MGDGLSRICVNRRISLVQCAVNKSQRLFCCTVLHLPRYPVGQFFVSISCCMRKLVERQRILKRK